MSFEALLDRLNGVKRTGQGRAMARCPAHDDRSPSLGVKDCGEGFTIVNCLAGCETADVLSAVGLTFADVMPERIGNEHSYKPMRKRFDASQILKVLRSEATLVAIAAENMAEGITLSDDDQNRVFNAACRIRAATKGAL